MKRVIYLFFAVLSLNSALAAEENYGFYAGLNAGHASDGGSDIEKMQGSTLGGQFGYRWVHYALEVGYSKFNLTADKGQSDDFFIDKAEINANVVDLAFKVFILRYLTLGIGVSAVSGDQDIRLSNVNGDPSAEASLEGDADYSGAFFQAGLVLPMLRNLDVWLMYTKRNWTTTDVSMDSSGNLGLSEITFGIQQLSGHIVYYFD